MKLGKIKLLLIIILIFWSTHYAMAWKAKSDTTVYVGAWGGVSYANIMGSTKPTFSFNDWCAGIDIEYRANQEIALKSGFAIINKGFKINSEYFDVDYNSIGEWTTTHRFSYLTIPIEGVYNFGKRKFNVWLSAGFHIGILAKQNTYATLPQSVNGIKVDPIDYDNSSIYKKLNLGLTLGLGIEYKLKPNIVAFADIKYEHGLSKILKIDTIYMLKHRGYYAGIGIKFGIPINYRVSG